MEEWYIRVLCLCLKVNKSLLILHQVPCGPVRSTGVRSCSLTACLLLLSSALSPAWPPVPFPLLSGAAVPSSLALPWFGSEVQSPVEMYGFCAQPCVTHLLFFGVPWLAICSKMCVWTVVLLASLPLEAVGAQTSRS